MSAPRRTHSAYHDALGLAIRVMRRERGLSQVALGRRAGLHRSYLGSLERGEINPSVRILLQVERGLQVPLAVVFKRAAVYARADPRFAATGSERSRR